MTCWKEPRSYKIRIYVYRISGREKFLITIFYMMESKTGQRILSLPQPIWSIKKAKTLWNNWNRCYISWKHSQPSTLYKHRITSHLNALFRYDHFWGQSRRKTSMKVHSMLALEAVEEPHWCNAHVWVSKTASHGYSLRVFSKNLKFYIVPKLYMTKLPVSCYTGFTKTKNTKNCPDYLVKSTTFLCFSDFFFSGLGICP